MKKIALWLICLITSLLPFNGIYAAAPANSGIIMYASPEQHAKVIRTIPIGQPIIPIIEKNAWLKIADPNTGDVGWTPKATLIGGTMQQPFMQRFTLTEQGPQGKTVQKSYYIESNFPNQDPKQIQAWLDAFRKEQQAIRDNFNYMIDPMKLFFPWHPVVIIKEQNSANPMVNQPLKKTQ